MNHAGQFEQLCELALNYRDAFERSAADGQIDAREQAALARQFRVIEGRLEIAACSVAIAAQHLNLGYQVAPSRALQLRGDEIRARYGHRNAATRCHVLRR